MIEMITYNGALLKDTYFTKICQKAAAILRYYQMAEIISMSKDAARLEAELLSELSSLTADLRLSADIMIKEQEEELFPLLSDILKKIKASSSVKRCHKTATAANLRAESVIRDKINVTDKNMIIDYADAAARYKNDPSIRDAIEVIGVFNELGSLCLKQDKLSADMSKLNAVKPKFLSRHYNIMLRMKQAIDEKIVLVKDAGVLIDALSVACAVIDSFGVYSKTKVNDFLNTDMANIIDNMSSIYISSIKGG